MLVSRGDRRAPRPQSFGAGYAKEATDVLRETSNAGRSIAALAVVVVADEAAGQAGAVAPPAAQVAPRTTRMVRTSPLRIRRRRAVAMRHPRTLVTDLIIAGRRVSSVVVVVVGGGARAARVARVVSRPRIVVAAIEHREAVSRDKVGNATNVAIRLRGRAVARAVAAMASRAVVADSAAGPGSRAARARRSPGRARVEARREAGLRG